MFFDLKFATFLFSHRQRNICSAILSTYDPMGIYHTVNKTIWPKYLIQISVTLGCRKPKPGVFHCFVAIVRVYYVEFFVFFVLRH